MVIIQRSGIGQRQDADTIRYVDRLDTDLSHYFEINIDDTNNLIDFLSKIGDFRFKDADDSDNSDVISMTCDDASGSMLIKTSCITDKSIFEILASGTYSGASATADIIFIDLDLDGMTINDAATNTITLIGERIDMDGITATAVSISSVTGLYIDMPSSGEYAVEYGALITADKTVVSNGAIALETSRDMGGTLAAAESFTNYANIFGQAVSHSGGDFILTADEGVCKVVMSYSGTVAMTSPDVFSSTGLYIDIDADVNVGTSDAKVDVSARALDIAYTLAETDGVLRTAATDIARITYTMPNGLSSAGAHQIDIFEINLDAVVANDANLTLNGIYIDASGLTNTSSAALRLISAVAPDDSNIDEMIYLVADTTTANSTQNIETSRDINGTVAGAVALTNYANVMGQSVSHTGGDFIVTQTASSAGVLQLNLNHDCDLTVTNEDVFSSTALDINITADMDDASAQIDIAARAIDITYGISRTAAGTQNIDATDIFRINLDVAASVNVGDSGAGNFNMIMLDGDGFIPAANITNNMNICGIMYDWSSASANDANASIFGMHMTMPSTAHNTAAAVEGIRILGDTTDANNAVVGMNISKDLTNTAAGAGITQSNSAFLISQTSSNDEAQIMTVSNTVASIEVSNTASLAGADVYSGTVLDMGYTATTDGTGTATSSQTALLIDYNLVETAGTLTLNSFNIGYIDFDTTGTVSYAAGTYRGLYINMTDAGVPTYAASCTLYGLEIDISSLDASDTDLTMYGFKATIPTSVGVAQERAAGFFSDGTQSAKLGNGSMGISATGINDEKYYRCEDFDEEAAAVTLDAGVRGDEWTFGGTNGDAADVTYIQLIGGAIRMETDGADDDSVYALWLNTAVNISANPIIEFRVQVNSVAASILGMGVGLAEAGVFTTMAFDAVDDDYIMVTINSDTANPANLKLVTEDNNGGITTADLGVAMSANTWCTIRIDCTDTEQPRIWVNNTGGAITPAHEIPAATVGAGTIQDAIYMYPVLFVICLDSSPSAQHIEVDYIKIWQDRA